MHVFGVVNMLMSQTKRLTAQENDKYQDLSVVYGTSGEYIFQAVLCHPKCIVSKVPFENIWVSRH